MVGMVKQSHMDVTICTCGKCKHSWVPDVKLKDGKLVQPLPVACAACKSAYWNR